MTPENDDERFVVGWQKAKTLEEACIATGYATDERGKNACRMMASSMRGRGIPLKRFGKMRRYNLARLKILAAEALEEEK